MGGEPCLKNLRALFGGHTIHELVEHGWMPHHEFMEAVGRCDVVLQVTHSETFNIVAADAVSLGVPTLGGFDIFWLPHLLTFDPNEWAGISQSIIMLIKYPDKWLELHREALDRLAHYYRDGVARWRAYLH